MKAIACLDKNNGIGKNGKLLISIPNDMKFFRETTKNNIVIMGRKTLFSFKDKAPLKNRINIVFTTNDKLKNEYTNFDNIFFVKNIDEMNNIIKNYKDKESFLIGGEKLYNDLIDLCDTALITRVDKSFIADSYFPNLEKHNFKIQETSKDFEYNNIKYKFIKYIKL